MDTLALAVPSQISINSEEMLSESHLDTPEQPQVGADAVPYILNLDHDILLHIFHLNTFTPETEYCIHDQKFTTQSPVNSTRYASQVCRAWRHILLGSPAIWGSLVDLSIINRSTETWAEELMKRTGESDLAIYGPVGSSPRSRAFFTSLLTSQWHRIRRLDVVITDPLWISSETWDIIFTRPAPTLEKFIVRASDNGTVFPPTDIQRPMFANSAPALRRFHCSLIEVQYKTAWMAQLSSVTLKFPIGTTEVLSVLRTTVRLESLVIDTSISNPEEETKSQRDSEAIALPHLRRLHILGNSHQAIFYLQRIVTHHDCALALQITDEAVNVSTDQLEEIASAVIPYTKRYFDVYKPQGLFVLVGHLTFDIENIVKTDMEYFAHPEARLGFQFMSRIHQHVTLSLNPILSILASLTLDSITELHLINSLVSWIEADDDDFVTFIKSLTAVNKLIINQYTLTLINDVDLDPSIILPSLQDVHLEAGSTLSPNFPRQLLTFLGRRKNAGVAVEALDLSGLVHAQHAYNWTFLDEIDGLHVMWLNGSEEIGYICGSGDGKQRLIW